MVTEFWAGQDFIRTYIHTYGRIDRICNVLYYSDQIEIYSKPKHQAYNNRQWDTRHQNAIHKIRLLRLGKYQNNLLYNKEILPALPPPPPPA